MFTLLHYLNRRLADKAALQDDFQRMQENIPEESRGKRSKSGDMPIKSGGMLQLYRDMVAKSGDMWHLFRDMAAMSGDTRKKLRDRSRMSGDMEEKFRDMSRMSASMRQMPGDPFSKLPDMKLMPEDLEGMSANFAGMAPGVVAWVAWLRNKAHHWRAGLARWCFQTFDREERRERRRRRRAEFDARFVIEYLTLEEYERLYGPFQHKASSQWPADVWFLDAERSWKRKAKRTLALLLAFVRLLLQRPEKKHRWTFTLGLAQPALDLCGPLSPRPPPFAFH